MKMLMQLSDAILKPIVLPLFQKVIQPVQKLFASILELPKKVQAAIGEKMNKKEHSLKQYVKIGHRFYSKRLLLALLALLVLGGYTLIFWKPPAFVDQLLGRARNVLVEGTKQVGAFSGFGKIVTANGQVRYEGDLAKGKFAGTGTLYNETGRIVYKGEFKDGKMNGQGEIYSGMGVLLYKGQLAEGVYAGTGATYHSNGKILYEGEFKNGKLNGQGIRYYVTGVMQYQGEFKNDAYSGKGTEFYPNGQIKYDGTFLENKYDGTGKMNDESGKPLYDGEFKNGLYAGKGKEFYPDGMVKYDGEFANGKYQGAGKMSHPNAKPLYVGAFVGGKFEGDGEKFDAEGRSVYKGQFVGGLEEGRGERYDEKGALQYKGFFKDGLPFYQGFLGLAPAALEELLGKPTEATVPEGPGEPVLTLNYIPFQMSFIAEISPENSKETFVTAVQVWNTQSLQEIEKVLLPNGADSAVLTPPPASASSKAVPLQAQLVRKEGNITVYELAEYRYYCYYEGPRLVRVQITKIE
ncbi:MAG: hypothetical protein WCC10_10255 [Tumebacillaceae bacterium]